MVLWFLELKGENMDWMRDMYTTNRIVLYLEAEATNLGPWINIFIILGGVKDYIIEIH